MAYSILQRPSHTSYRESGHDGFRVFRVDSGPPRIRTDKAKSNPIIDLTWDEDSSGFWALMIAHKERRHDEWLISFVSAEAGHGTYLCRLIPGTFGWRPQYEADYSVFCSVEVIESDAP